MLPEQTAISEFKVYLASLATEERRLSEELQMVQKTITAVQQVMNGYSDWRAQHQVAEPVKQPQVVADHIMHCSGQNQALVVIAKGSNGFVKSRQAGRLFMDAGLTKSQNINAAGATAYRRLTEHPDFDYHEPGTFKYLPFFTDAQTSVQPTNPTIATNGHTLDGF